MLSAQQSLKNATFEVKEKLNKNKENLVDQVIYCNASFDGLWQKRGYSSKNGIVSAISKDNGRVLGFTVLTKKLKNMQILGREKQHQNMNSSY